MPETFFLYENVWPTTCVKIHNNSATIIYYSRNLAMSLLSFWFSSFHVWRVCCLADLWKTLHFSEILKMKLRNENWTTDIEFRVISEVQKLKKALTSVESFKGKILSAVFFVWILSFNSNFDESYSFTYCKVIGYILLFFVRAFHSSTNMTIDFPWIYLNCTLTCSTAGPSQGLKIRGGT